ncbi:MAG TPA: GNAT family N-acetyltransferase [Candidatus Bilamarchaeaceae archaeon]|nr:GNAT family N-acetyltransferase [Candidatus Bilamarchaeaceae archaeon]
MRIRKAGFSEELASLVRRLFPGSEPLFRDKDSYFIAEEDGRIVGFSHLIEAEGRMLLQGIGVLQEWRERGIGGRLLDASIRFADRKGMDVFLKVRPDNPALGLYYKKGFTLKKIKDVYVLERKRKN